MARIRTIKPDFFRHAGLFDAEVETGLPLRVAYAGLWTSCDREGRFQWKPRELKLDALPFDLVDFSRVLDALLTRGHIVKYRVDGIDFGFIPSWHDHQVINNREANSVLPAPDENSIKSATSTREARVADACATPLMHAQVEGKGKEGEGKGREGGSAKASRSPRVSRPAISQSATAAVWTAYALAYQERYGAMPVRNGKINGQLAQFIGRIGAEEAPDVARFFVGHQNAFYVRGMHAVDAMLKDAEKLRTEWATGRRVTNLQATQADRTQTNLNAFEPLLAEARLREAEERAHG